MEQAPTKTTAKDFFLWAGALIALYTAATTLISLLFDYINYAYPDPLAGAGDPYGSSMRFSMALLIVAAPTALVLFRFIRTSIAADASRAQVWVRRWGLMLTLFVAATTGLIDLATLINYFLGGEITTRFALKVAVVLLVAIGAFLHFLADLKGYWDTNRKLSGVIAAAVGVLVLSSIIASYFVIGSPTHIRDLRSDSQRVGDLSSIQSQILSYYQQKRVLPQTLADVSDPLMYYTVPSDPETKSAYEYSTDHKLSFTLCADFKTDSPDTAGKGDYPYGIGGAVATDIAYPSSYGLSASDTVWTHAAGHTCFTRSIDPEKFPATSSVKGL